MRGEPPIPEGPREVDVFIRVVPLEGNFPADYLRPDLEPNAQPFQVGRGVSYTERTELIINGLHGVRAQFTSTGPTPNWGTEYAIRKEDRVLDAYVSQPSPEVEGDFDRVIQTLEW